MRENRTYGSEGGEGLHPFPTPIEVASGIAPVIASLILLPNRDCTSVPQSNTVAALPVP